ncbi:MAG TPA: polyphosphate kinase 2 family protein [Candidatus Dormibacteraeota bacterium]|nr:polyphosphate kinase 2 family protein [Candidatus Dormibacteraeota bacterium]
MTDTDLATLRRLAADLRVAPGTAVKLPAHVDPRHTPGFVHEADAGAALRAGVELLAGYQARLAAQDTYGVLVVLQALDAAGKDGAVKHVMSGVNPQGVRVSSFKVPSAEELAHDFLWRYTRDLPPRGMIGIYNRSHYEEVLVVRVHPENLARQHVPDDARGPEVWHRRFRAINAWERHLVENGFHVTKVFLHLSAAEQRRRLLARIDDPEKNWKFSLADVEERACWDDYQHAYSEVLSHTSTEWAPWHVVPADHKWFARLGVAAIIVDTLARIHPEFPRLGDAELAQLARARAQLEAEGG